MLFVFQGTYPGLFTDPFFPHQYFVLGSVYHYNPGIFHGKGFDCSNSRHFQFQKEVFKDQCYLRKTCGKVKNMKPSRAIQLGLCRSAGGFVFAPTTDILRTTSKEIARLTMFIVVIRDWIDFKNRLVVVPNRMQLKRGNKVLHSSPTKCVFTLTADDHNYFNYYKTDGLANRRDWSEYSFNNCIGPIITLSDAISFRDVFNQIFVADLHNMQKKVTENV